MKMIFTVNTRNDIITICISLGLKVMSNKQNHLYVFVKGHKGKGAFEITDSDFNVKHTDVVEGKETTSPFLMDLKAIERCLEYIRDNRGNKVIPHEPVVFIFTTFENNYHVASGIKDPNKYEMKTFSKKYTQLRKDLVRKNKNQHDEVKCYWIPDNFENRIEDVKKLLD
jgi:hypothetical protein